MANVVGAEWINERRGLLFFDRNLSDEECSGFSGKLSINGTFQEFYLSRASPLDFAETSGFFEENETIVFALSKNALPRPVLTEEKFYLAGDINQWLSAGASEKWQLRCENIQEKSYFTLKISKNELPEYFQFKFVSENWDWLPLPDYCKNCAISQPGIENFEYNAQKTGRHVLQFDPPDGRCDLCGSAHIVFETQKVPIGDSRLLFAMHSDEKFGAWIENNETFFALFAPRVSAVEIRWKSSLEENFSNAPMSRGPNGVWYGKIVD
jgi:hypothetical protein